MVMVGYDSLLRRIFGDKKDTEYVYRIVFTVRDWSSQISGKVRSESFWMS